MSENIQTSIPQLMLRPAREDDTAQILEFIKKLAEYEKLSHEVTATPEILKQSLFGTRKVAEVIIAYYNNQPVGFSLFFYNFSTFLGKPGIYIEDIFVNPESRGKGIGKALLQYVTRLALERGCGRVEWSVLDWNKPAITFYKNIGARAMDGWTVFRLDGKKLEDLANQ